MNSKVKNSGLQTDGKNKQEHECDECQSKQAGEAQVSGNAGAFFTQRIDN